MQIDQNILDHNLRQQRHEIEVMSGHYAYVASHNIRRAATALFERERKQFIPHPLTITEIQEGQPGGPVIYRVRLPINEELIIKRLLSRSFLFDFHHISDGILRPIEIQNAALIDPFAYLKLPPRGKKTLPVIHKMSLSLFRKLWTPLC